MSERQRTGIDRREALKRVGALAATPVLSGYHPLVPVQPGRASWEPAFLDAQQAELVADLAEHIVPETETPGARAARVHQYVDHVLAGSPAERKEAFVSGLRRFDGVSSERQLELLREIEDSPFFRELKELVVTGYYESAVGTSQELGIEGRRFVTEFEGCTHEEHQRFRRGG